jgi:hypothetical protein
MQHENWFVLPSKLGRHGLLQISPPTAQEIAAAAALINAAFDRLVSSPESPEGSPHRFTFPRPLSGGPDAVLFVAGQC